MIIAGIDPGLSGAVFMMDAEGDVMGTYFDIPVHELRRGGKTKRSLDAHGLAAFLRDFRIGHAFVEDVNAMPGQGVSSVFAFGMSKGIIIGVLAALGVPMTLVSPQKWKKALGVPAAKDGARARASQLLPSCAGQWPLAKHDGRAEAALIALYGIRAFDQIASGKPE